MNSSDAEKATDQKLIELADQQMVRILASIKTAISKGLYETTLYETLYQPNIDILKDYDFQVIKRGGRMGEHNYIIKWPDQAPELPPSETNTYYPGGITPQHPPL